MISLHNYAIWGRGNFTGTRVFPLCTVDSRFRTRHCTAESYVEFPVYFRPFGTLQFLEALFPPAFSSAKKSTGNEVAVIMSRTNDRDNDNNHNGNNGDDLDNDNDNVNDKDDKDNSKNSNNNDNDDNDDDDTDNVQDSNNTVNNRW